MKKECAFLIVFLLLGLGAKLNAQNTVFGEAKIVPEVEVSRQSDFIDAEKEQLLGNYDKAIELFKKFLYDNPDNDVAWYCLAKTYIAQKNYGDALDAIGKAILGDPGNEWYRITQADVLQVQGKNKEAADVYEELIKKQPNTPDFYKQLAYLQVLTGNPKDGLKTLDKLETLIGLTEEIASKKHVIYLGLGDEKKAAAEIQKLIDVYPTKIAYRHKLAEFYDATGNTAAARKVYEQVLIIEPNDPVAKMATLDRPQAGSDAANLLALKPVFSDPSISIDAKIKLPL